MDPVSRLNPFAEFGQGHVGLFLHGRSKHGTALPQGPSASASEGPGSYTACVPLSLAPLVDRRLADTKDLSNFAQRLLANGDDCHHTFTQVLGIRSHNNECNRFSA